MWDHADLDEVRKECRAQIERAIVWGFDVSHLDSHMGTLQLRPDFFDVYLEMAVDFGLPLRLAAPRPSASSASRSGASPPRKASCSPTTSCARPARAGGSSGRCSTCGPASPRSTLHPGVDTDELRAACSDDWAGRVEDHALLSRDPSFRDLVARAGATVIGWRALRDLQRA